MQKRVVFLLNLHRPRVTSKAITYKVPGLPVKLYLKQAQGYQLWNNLYRPWGYQLGFNLHRPRVTRKSYRGLPRENLVVSLSFISRAFRYQRTNILMKLQTNRRTLSLKYNLQTCIVDFPLGLFLQQGEIMSSTNKTHYMNIDLNKVLLSLFCKPTYVQDIKSSQYQTWTYLTFQHLSSQSVQQDFIVTRSSR